jgi:hypothetical protein
MYHSPPDAGDRATVLLDSRDVIGALIVTVPAFMVGVEIAICPLGELRHVTPRDSVGVQHKPGLLARGFTAVFDSVPEGLYELYRKPNGPTEVVAEVRGGRLTEVEWPP